MPVMMKNKTRMFVYWYFWYLCCISLNTQVSLTMHDIYIPSSIAREAMFEDDVSDL